ncbi:MAG: hypothetical protein F6K25_27805 [Okeania sp. SIO2G4]|uniref:hypothetical protein n=1 Tax=unclassified Okeania TaxID=2634635 RepID=UPI0013BC062C|nr:MULTISPECIES: hypothetical protein [unclassified Okeania]NEP42062.1 hypothetical protein [Okeania sp. SIO2H7]NEP74717.1 hypothetical protein [Okeania sp. SIO2G5]NEP95758.1 hypothetical protein [Okeania sp. SIO2F5]NEQ94251.1 hypothetical protein [Okeania sp. SIO2G4]
MKPKINNITAWRQAELLMQPAFIRLLDHIRKKLDNSVWQGDYQEVEKPIPGYRLDLEYQDQKVSIDIWELCYQVCFSNYHFTHSSEQIVEVEVDTSLLNDEGNVNWEHLDEKALRVVENMMADLPTV